MMTLSSFCFIALFMSCAAERFIVTLVDLKNMGRPAEFENENFTKLAVANNDLALHIHRELASGSTENIFFSPLSLSTAFGMLYYGTRGNTSKELRRVLGYETAGIPEELLHHTFRKYLTESLPSQDPSAYDLNVANAILLDKHLNLVKSYKRDVEDLYKASVREVDFTTQATQITPEINDWVKDQTNGKIEKLMEDLDPTTAFVILNAVYFKGTWKTRFVSTKSGPGLFYNHGLQSESKKVTMMRMKNKFSYTEDDDVKVLEMPYKGGNVSMFVFLPKELDGLEKFEKNVTQEKIFTFRHQFRKTTIDLTIPKFKVEYSKDLSDVFQSIGAKSIFTSGADLSGIISTPNVFISQVLHKAVVEVNEEGSQAAAISVIHSRKKSGPRYTRFTVNRPFLFAIVDKRCDMILFQGRITNL